MSGARVRMADALLRSVGGRTVLLRMPTPAIAGDANEQLGLATPSFQDFALAPVVFRRVRARVGAEGIESEVLVSATAVDALAGRVADGAAEVIFRDALGVVVDGALYELTGVTAAEAFGAVYLWRLKVHGAVGSVV